MGRTFIPGQGWRTFDPTPFIEKQIDFKLISVIKKYTNAMNFWLSRYLVDYDSKKQRKLYFDTRNYLQEVNYKTILFKFKDPFYLFIAILIILIFYNIFRKKRMLVKYPQYYMDFIKFTSSHGSEIRKKEI